MLLTTIQELLLSANLVLCFSKMWHRCNRIILSSSRLRLIGDCYHTCSTAFSWNVHPSSLSNIFFEIWTVIHVSCQTHVAKALCQELLKFTLWRLQVWRKQMCTYQTCGELFKVDGRWCTKYKGVSLCKCKAACTGQKSLSLRQLQEQRAKVILEDHDKYCTFS